MKEMRTIRDSYTDIKRTPAMYGPYRRKSVPTNWWKLIALGLIVFVVLWR